MSRKKIVIVDDEPEILDLFEIFLYKDFEVFTASNGFDGLKVVKEVQPDCVITDIMMPALDGIKFLNRFRKIERMEHVPVIAVTAFSATLQEKSLRNIGFALVVAKPVSRIVLIEAINDVLEEA